MMNLSTFKKFPILIIEYLKKGPASKNEILEVFDIKQSTFYKHINLLKKTGFIVERQNEIFELINFSNQIKFSLHETNLLAHLLLTCYSMLPEYRGRDFENATKKILYLTNEENYNCTFKKYELFRSFSFHDYYQEKIFLINKFLNTQGEMSITLNTKQKLNIVPMCYALEKTKASLNYIDKDTRKLGEAPLKKIVKISQIGQEDILPIRKETVFELYGRLADIYVLKDGERIIDSGKEKIVIANGYEEKGILFKRLLRYDILCKISHPKKDVEEFKNLLTKTIEMFNEANEKDKQTI